MTSNAPPSVSPASLAASIAAIIVCCRLSSTQRSGESSDERLRFLERHRPIAGGSAIPPMADTWLVIRTPNRPRSWRASDPAATRAAVSRALARSSTSRTSVWPYLIAPARSACPGRGRVTSGRLAAGRALRHLALDVHRLLPVDPVAVANEQGDRGAGRAAVANAGDDLGAVAFDLHPAAAAVAALATTELGVQGVDIDLETRGHPVEGHHERLAVRLTRGEKSQHPSSILYEEIAHFRGRAIAIAPKNGAGPRLHGRGHEPTAARSLLRLRRRARLGSGNGRERSHHRPGDCRSHIGARLGEPLVEVLDHGRDGEPRWVVVETGAGQSSLAVARRVAEQARVRGLVPIAVDVYLRLRRVLEEELRHRTLMLILAPGSPLEPAREAIVSAAATSPRPHVLVSFRSTRPSTAGL